MAPVTPRQPLPKILCLHGAGSSGAIFQAQCRKITRSLRNELEFVYVDAPFASKAGPGMWPVYSDSGPFFRWHCDEAATEGFDITDAEVRTEREKVRSMFESIFAESKDAPFIGVMAFSQGARVATGLLQYLEKMSREGCQGWPDMKFAILCSGTYPPLLIDEDANTAATGEGGSVVDEQDLPASEAVGDDTVNTVESRKLRIPSIHLHGTRDPWKTESERLAQDCYAEESSTVIQFAGGHQIPPQDIDVARVSGEILRQLLKASRGPLGMVVIYAT
ncbi:hypothetical protein GQ53DRAFT_838510 [Thozetella sp. PMI_491]|nr:hypothetical protein GQ53DRAFT_838510 [Thozetella sp. PMI_491]